jgi:hypothetical protein
MSSESIIRIIALCIVLACTETLNGIARTVVLVPRIGKYRALKLSFVSASLLAFIICLLLVPGIGLSGLDEHVYLGLFLASFMALFDIVTGMLLLKRSWRKAVSDFNPHTGNYLIFGLALLVVFPSIVFYIVGTP